MFVARAVRWADLTPLEQSEFGNGCGPKWFPAWFTALLFGWFFEASCRRHDFGYARGGTGLDRYAVDLGFYQSMLNDAERAPVSLRPLLRVVATVFYVLVKVLGWTRFNYGPYQSKAALIAVAAV